MIKKNKGYKFRLKPNREQIIYFEKAFGCSRKMYNLYVDILYKELEEQNYISGKIDYKSIKLPTPAVIKREMEKPTTKNQRSRKKP
jgi:putative transposase